MKAKLIRTSTIPVSLNILLKGQLMFLNKHYNIIAVSGKGKDLEEVAEREKVVVHKIEMRRNISLMKDLITLIKLYSFFRKEKPLIIHSITPKAGLLSMAAARFAGVPVRMHTFTGLIFPAHIGIMQKILIKMDQVLCACATNIYPEGVGVMNDLLSYKITSKPLKVLANGNVNGIDSSYFDPKLYSTEDKQKLRNDLKIQADDFVFLFVGRLVGDKGINELVEAFKRLDSEMGRKRNVSKLLMVGDFERDLDPLLPEKLSEIEINPNIITVGYQSDVRPYFAISNALVFPSYREGFPNVVMQAGAMGLPSIVSNINGCNEIIIEEENGLIIPPKNTNALYQAMFKFVVDRSLVNKLKTNSRRMIVERYEQQAVWDAILAEYKRLEENVKKRE